MAATNLPAHARFHSDRPLPPKEQLPTMYDLPSEDPEEPGLPDDFHYYQPQLLRETFRPPERPPEGFYVGTDINLYFDPEHTRWHKRPDWFAVLGAPRLYQGRDLRLSYVVWQEEVVPYLVVELLSPGTEAEDPGQTRSQAGEPPPKWEVYERILRVPYYAVYGRYDRRLRLFALQAGRYREQTVGEAPFWLPEARLGLGLWDGAYQGIAARWLRWFDADGRPLPTEAERLAEEHHLAEEARRQAQEAQLRARADHQRAQAAQRQAEAAQHQAEAARQQAEAARREAQEEREHRERLEGRLAELEARLDALARQDKGPD
jgi:Uma2 family endonuclease